MDDDLLLILLAVLIFVPMLVGIFLYLHVRARQRQAVVPIVTTAQTAYSASEPRFRSAPRQVRAEPEVRSDIDACLARIFTKTVVSERYAGVVVDNIPSVVLHQLDKIIEESAYIKHTTNFVGKIDALESNVEDLVNLVATDPLLSATVLRQANSTYYGARSEVTSLKFAIELVGISNLKNLVYREYVLRSHKGKAMPDPALFALTWEHALLCATTAAYLSPAFPGTDPAQVYTTALLHDIGKFLLLSSDLLDLQNDRCVLPYQGGFLADTKRLWRYDHALAGKIAALKWDFGPEVAGAIGMHHYAEVMNMHHLNLGNDQIQALALIHVANQVAKFFSGEPRTSNHLSPLHFSFHRSVDQQAVRAILSGSNLLADLKRIKGGMSFDSDG